MDGGSPVPLQDRALSAKAVIMTTTKRASKEQVKYAVFVRVEGKPAEVKPDIRAYSQAVATKTARQLYGPKAFVVPPYNPE